MENGKHKMNYRLAKLNNTQNPRFIDKSEVNLMRYFHDIRKYKLLTQDEEQDIITRIKANVGNTEELKAKLIGSHLPFVVMFAKRYCPYSSGQLLDLIQEGNYGMLIALERFNPSMETKFVAYANAYIIKSMFTFLANNDLVQRKNRSRTFGVDARLRNEFFKTYGYEPTSQELLDMFNDMGVPIKHKEDFDTISITSLEAPITGCRSNYDDDDEMVTQYGEDNTIVEDIDKSVAVENVRRIMKNLTPFEQTVIRKRFGFDGVDEDINRIAKETGASTHKIKRTLDRVLRRMRMYKKIQM